MATNWSHLVDKYPVKGLITDRVLNKYVSTTSNEVCWNIAYCDDDQKQPILYHSGLEDLRAKHAPYCRCPKCPLHSDKVYKRNRYVTKSNPFKMYINPRVSYLSAKDPQKHMPFCQCELICQKTSVNYIVPLYVTKMMTKLLKHSPYSKADLESRPKIKAWRKKTIEVALEKIRAAHLGQNQQVMQPEEESLYPQVIPQEYVPQQEEPRAKRPRIEKEVKAAADEQVGVLLHISENNEEGIAVDMSLLEAFEKFDAENGGASKKTEEPVEENINQDLTDFLSENFMDDNLMLEESSLQNFDFEALLNDDLDF